MLLRYRNSCAILSSLLVFCSPGAALAEKKLPALEALVPSYDKTAPSSLSNLKLKGSVSDSINPSLIAIPRSDSVSAYNAGIKLYKTGDFQRALTAFRIALEKARKFGSEDQRYKAAKKAIESTRKNLTLRKQYGYDTDAKDKNALTGTVTKVFPPSLAWLGGLKEGDRILKADQSKTKILLTVKRNNNLYGLTLRLKEDRPVDPKTANDADPGTKSRTNFSGIASSAHAGVIRHPEILSGQIKRLASYDCVLLLDCSGSMGDRIVSIGRPSQGPLMTRWNWCRSEMLKFYSQGAPYFPEGITLVPFANKFAIINEAREPAIKQLFNQLSPVGATNMAAPLSFLFDDYFRRKARNKGRVKPLVIAILSDGEGNAHVLRQLITKTTHRMQYANEIKITFLAVDATSEGRPVIEALDDGLHNAEAKFDIVDSRTFEELQRYGLLRMVVAALVEKQVE